MEKAWATESCETGSPAEWDAVFDAPWEEYCAYGDHLSHFLSSSDSECATNGISRQSVVDCAPVLSKFSTMECARDAMTFDWENDYCVPLRNDTSPDLLTEIGCDSQCLSELKQSDLSTFCESRVDYWVGTEARPRFPSGCAATDAANDAWRSQDWRAWCLAKASNTAEGICSAAACDCSSNGGFMGGDACELSCSLGSDGSVCNEATSSGICDYPETLDSKVDAYYADESMLIVPKRASEFQGVCKCANSRALAKDGCDVSCDAEDGEPVCNQRNYTEYAETWQISACHAGGTGVCACLPPLTRQVQENVSDWRGNKATVLSFEYGGLPAKAPWAEQFRVRAAQGPESLMIRLFNYSQSTWRTARHKFEEQPTLFPCGDRQCDFSDVVLAQSLYTTSSFFGPTCSRRCPSVDTGESLVKYEGACDFADPVRADRLTLEACQNECLDEWRCNFVRFNNITSDCRLYELCAPSSASGEDDVFWYERKLTSTPETTPCSGRGACTMTGTCVCDSAKFLSLTDPITGKRMRVQADERSSLAEVPTTSLETTGYRNDDCSLVCPGFDPEVSDMSGVCSGHGICTRSAVCQCAPGFTGQNCEYSCPSLDSVDDTTTTCSGHGTCSEARMFPVESSVEIEDVQQQYVLTEAWRKWINACKDSQDIDFLILPFGNYPGVLDQATIKGGVDCEAVPQQVVDDIKKKYTDRPVIELLAIRDFIATDMERDLDADSMEVEGRSDDQGHEREGVFRRRYWNESDTWKSQNVFVSGYKEVRVEDGSMYEMFPGFRCDGEQIGARETGLATVGECGLRCEDLDGCACFDYQEHYHSAFLGGCRLSKPGLLHGFPIHSALQIGAENGLMEKHLDGDLTPFDEFAETFVELQSDKSCRATTVNIGDNVASVEDCAQVCANRYDDGCRYFTWSSEVRRCSEVKTSSSACEEGFNTDPSGFFAVSVVNQGATAPTAYHVSGSARLFPKDKVRGTVSGTYYGRARAEWSIGVGQCSCSKSYGFGHWSGFACQSCSQYFGGESCTKQCPGIVGGKPCFSNGACLWGSKDGLGVPGTFYDATCLCGEPPAPKSGDLSLTGTWSVESFDLHVEATFQRLSAQTEYFENPNNYGFADAQCRSCIEQRGGRNCASQCSWCLFGGNCQFSVSDSISVPCRCSSNYYDPENGCAPEGFILDHLSIRKDTGGLSEINRARRLEAAPGNDVATGVFYDDAVYPNVQTSLFPSRRFTAPCPNVHETNWMKDLSLVSSRACKSLGNCRNQGARKMIVNGIPPRYFPLSCLELNKGGVAEDTAWESAFRELFFTYEEKFLLNASNPSSSEGYYGGDGTYASFSRYQLNDAGEEVFKDFTLEQFISNCRRSCADQPNCVGAVIKRIYGTKNAYCYLSQNTFIASPSQEFISTEPNALFTIYRIKREYDFCKLSDPRNVAVLIKENAACSASGQQTPGARLPSSDPLYDPDAAQECMNRCVALHPTYNSFWVNPNDHCYCNQQCTPADLSNWNGANSYQITRPDYRWCSLGSVTYGEIELCADVALTKQNEDATTDSGLADIDITMGNLGARCEVDVSSDGEDPQWEARAGSDCAGVNETKIRLHDATSVMLDYANGANALVFGAYKTGEFEASVAKVAQNSFGEMRPENPCNGKAGYFWSITDKTKCEHAETRQTCNIHDWKLCPEAQVSSDTDLHSVHDLRAMYPHRLTVGGSELEATVVELDFTFNLQTIDSSDIDGEISDEQQKITDATAEITRLEGVLTSDKAAEASAKQDAVDSYNLWETYAEDYWPTCSNVHTGTSDKWCHILGIGYVCGSIYHYEWQCWEKEQTRLKRLEHEADVAIYDNKVTARQATEKLLADEKTKKTNAESLKVQYEQDKVNMVAGETCSPDRKCDLCQGNCDNDSECRDGLVCFSNPNTGQANYFCGGSTPATSTSYCLRVVDSTKTPYLVGYAAHAGSYTTKIVEVNPSTGSIMAQYTESHNDLSSSDSAPDDSASLYDKRSEPRLVRDATTLAGYIFGTGVVGNVAREGKALSSINAPRGFQVGDAGECKQLCEQTAGCTAASVVKTMTDYGTFRVRNDGAFCQFLGDGRIMPYDPDTSLSRAQAVEKCRSTCVEISDFQTASFLIGVLGEYMDDCRCFPNTYENCAASTTPLEGDWLIRYKVYDSYIEVDTSKQFKCMLHTLSVPESAQCSSLSSSIGSDVMLLKPERCGLCKAMGMTPNLLEDDSAAQVRCSRQNKLDEYCEVFPTKDAEGVYSWSQKRCPPTRPGFEKMQTSIVRVGESFKLDEMSSYETISGHPDVQSFTHCESLCVSETKCVAWHFTDILSPQRGDDAVTHVCELFSYVPPMISTASEKENVFSGRTRIGTVQRDFSQVEIFMDDGDFASCDCNNNAESGGYDCGCKKTSFAPYKPYELDDNEWGCSNRGVCGGTGYFCVCDDGHEWAWGPASNNHGEGYTCRACAAGTYKNSDVKHCTSCPLGTYQDQTGQAQCTACGEQQPTTSATGAKSSGACLTCPTGRVVGSLTDKTHTNYLNLNFDDSTTLCLPCAVGKFDNGFGDAAASAARTCQDCPPGKTTSTYGMSVCDVTTITDECNEPGMAWENPDELDPEILGGSRCMLCAQGKYRDPEKSPYCLDCPIGYGSKLGDFGCQICPSGYYSEIVITYEVKTSGTCDEYITTYEECEAARAALGLSANSAQDALLGSSLYLDNCISSSDGSNVYFNHDGSPSHDCGHGNFNCLCKIVRPVMPAAADCTACGSGRYSDAGEGQGGDDICKGCDVGKYSDSGEAQTNSNVCKACTGGRYSDAGVGQTDSSACKACAAGRYEDELGSIACNACPQGRYMENEGHPGNQDVVGTVQNLKIFGTSIPALYDGNTLPCTYCDVAKYNSEEGSSSESNCKDCESGKYNLFYGSTSCLSCPPGRRSFEFSTRPFVQNLGRVGCDCKPGYYNGHSMISFNDTNGYRVWPTGAYGNATQRLGHDESCKACPAGYTQGPTHPHSVDGSDYCTPCPAGKFTASSGSLQCSDCEAGKFAAPTRQSTTFPMGNPVFNTNVDKFSDEGEFVHKVNGVGWQWKTCEQVDSANAPSDDIETSLAAFDKQLAGYYDYYPFRQPTAGHQHWHILKGYCPEMYQFKEDYTGKDIDDCKQACLDYITPGYESEGSTWCKFFAFHDPDGGTPYCILDKYHERSTERENCKLSDSERIIATYSEEERWFTHWMVNDSDSSNRVDPYTESCASTDEISCAGAFYSEYDWDVPEAMTWHTAWMNKTRMSCGIHDDIIKMDRFDKHEWKVRYDQTTRCWDGDDCRDVCKLPSLSVTYQKKMIQKILNRDHPNFDWYMEESRKAVGILMGTPQKLAVLSASQSNSISYPGSPASDAIDGNPSTFSRTKPYTPTSNWLEIVLRENVRQLTKVRLWNRQDCCQDELSDFFIEWQKFGETAWTECGSYNMVDAGPRDFSCAVESSVDIRAVRIRQKSSTGVEQKNLHLGEVEVHGDWVFVSRKEEDRWGETRSASSSYLQGGAHSPSHRWVVRFNPLFFEVGDKAYQHGNPMSYRWDYEKQRCECFAYTYDDCLANPDMYVIEDTDPKERFDLITWTDTGGSGAVQFSYRRAFTQTSCTTCAADGYQDETGQSSCKMCPPGKQVSGTACASCAAGKFKATEAGSCETCALGQFQEETGGVGCKNCPAGKFQQQTTLRVGNACTNCPPHFFQDEEGAEHSGTYPNTVMGCKLCDANLGQFQDEEGQSGCKLCGDGKTKNALQTTQVSGNALWGIFEDGWFWTFSGCTECAEGKYRAGTMVDCDHCTGSSGEYYGWPSEDHSECVYCRAGMYGDGITACKQCPEGWYNDNKNGAPGCKTCPQGYHDVLNILCEQCSAMGVFYDSSASVTMGIVPEYEFEGDGRCKEWKGINSEYGVSSGMEWTTRDECAYLCYNDPDCTMFSYRRGSEASSGLGDSRCQFPAAGFDCTGAAQKHSDEGYKTYSIVGPGSSPGTIAPWISQSFGGTVFDQSPNANPPAADAYNTVGELMCSSCPQGRYQYETGHSLSECKGCPKGRYEDETGAPRVGETSFCKECPAHTYSVEEGLTVCKECPRGFQRSAALDSRWCDPCPSGTGSRNEGIWQEGDPKTCELCPAGRASETTGRVWFGGQHGTGNLCSICGTGFYQNEVGQQSCKSCPDGWANTIQESNQCAQAAPGKYVSEDHSTLEPCPSGRYQNESRGQGINSCKDCPKGYDSEAESIECTACLAGKVSGLQGNCETCAAGTFQDKPGANWRGAELVEFFFPDPFEGYTTLKCPAEKEVLTTEVNDPSSYTNVNSIDDCRDYCERSAPISDKYRAPYVIVESGTCDSNGYAYITTQEECEAGATALGLSDTSAQVSSYTSFPRGCTTPAAGNSLIFVDIHTYNRCNAHPDYFCLCKVPADIDGFMYSSDRCTCLSDAFQDDTFYLEPACNNGASGLHLEPLPKIGVCTNPGLNRALITLANRPQDCKAQMVIRFGEGNSNGGNIINDYSFNKVTQTCTAYAYPGDDDFCTAFDTKPTDSEISFVTFTSGSCASNGYTAIASEEECDRAAQSLGFISTDPYRTYTALHNSYATGAAYPMCYRLSSTATYVSWNSAGSDMCKSNNPCLCSDRFRIFASGNCASNGYASIDNITECDEAAQKLGYPLPGGSSLSAYSAIAATFSTFNSDSCFASAVQAYFTYKSNDDDQCTSLNQCICKKITNTRYYGRFNHPKRNDGRLGGSHSAVLRATLDECLDKCLEMQEDDPAYDGMCFSASLYPAENNCYCQKTNGGAETYIFPTSVGDGFSTYQINHGHLDDIPWEDVMCVDSSSTDLCGWTGTPPTYADAVVDARCVLNTKDCRCKNPLVTKPLWGPDISIYVGSPSHAKIWELYFDDSGNKHEDGSQGARQNNIPECYGWCNSDDQCADGLVCHQRDAADCEHCAIPLADPSGRCVETGSLGLGWQNDADFCVQPVITNVDGCRERCIKTEGCTSISYGQGYHGESDQCWLFGHACDYFAGYELEVEDTNADWKSYKIDIENIEYKCKLCEPGKYQSDTGSSSCTSCPAGYTSNSLTEYVIVTSGTCGAQGFGQITTFAQCEAAATAFGRTIGHNQAYEDNVRPTCFVYDVSPEEVHYNSNPTAATTAESVTAALPGGIVCTNNAYGRTGCDACVPGKFSSSSSQFREGCGKCSASYYQPAPAQNGCPKCPHGWYTPATSYWASCSSVNVGHYANDAQTGPAPCPKGKYQNEMAQQGLASCKQCPSGFTTIGADKQSSCTICPIGYNTGDYNAIENGCAFCGISTSEAALDNYADETGQTWCKDCPDGSGVNAERTTCTACPEGKASVFTTDPPKKSCETCQAGTYPDDTCLECPDGQYSTSEETVCKDCAPGFYTNAAGQKALYEPNRAEDFFYCQPCSNGAYQDEAGMTFCKACPECQAGYIQTSGTAAVGCSNTCVACEAGKYQSGPSCTDCAAGKYSVTYEYKSSGTCDEYITTQEECEAALTMLWSLDDVHVDTVSWSSAALGCLTSPSGGSTQYFNSIGDSECGTATWNCVCKISDSSGNNACADCPAGFEARYQGNIVCRACFTGRYNPNTGVDECPFCPTGYYQNEQGSASCKHCPAGKFYTGSGLYYLGGCKDCPAGFYSGDGSGICTECPNGYGSHGSRGLSCSSCPTGRFSSTPEQKTNACVYCPAGWHSPSTGAGECTGCLSDNYQDEAGQTTCKECPTGWILTSNVDGCTSCAAGQYIKQTSSSSRDSCKDCPSGYYSEVAVDLQTDCKQCIGDQQVMTTSSCGDCSAGKWYQDSPKDCIDCPAGRSSPEGYTLPSSWGDWEWDFIGDPLALPPETFTYEKTAYGASISMSADTTIIAVGAPRATEPGGYTSAGVVTVYKYGTLGWKPMGERLVGDGSYELFGASVSLSSDGTIVAIAAPNGSVRVYEWSVTNGALGWTQQGYDIPRIGRSISLSADGTIVAIGNHLNGNIDGVWYRGEVSVYERDQSVALGWKQIGSDIEGFWNGTQGDYTGRSVSLSADGSVLAVGAPNSYAYMPGTLNAAGSEHGAVRIYERDASVGPGWTQAGQTIQLDPYGAGNYKLGTSVSLSADGLTVAAGAPFYDRPYGNLLDSGAVIVYQMHSNKVFYEAKTSGTCAQYVTTRDECNEARRDPYSSTFPDSDYPYPGVQSNAWDNRPSGCIVGGGGHGTVYFNSDTSVSFDCGHGGFNCICKYSGARWTPISEIIEGNLREAKFGWAVSLSADGTSVVAGAPGGSPRDPSDFDTSDNAETGYVYMYQRNPNHYTYGRGKDERWQFKFGEMKTGTIGDNFGYSVSAKGNIIAVGAPYNSNPYANSEHGEVFLITGDICNATNEYKIFTSGTCESNGWSFPTVVEECNEGAKQLGYPLGDYMPGNEKWTHIGTGITDPTSSTCFVNDVGKEWEKIAWNRPEGWITSTMECSTSKACICIRGFVM